MVTLNLRGFVEQLGEMLNLAHIFFFTGLELFMCEDIVSTDQQHYREHARRMQGKA